MKSLLLTAFVLISISLKGQLNAGFSGQTRGFGLSAGYLINEKFDTRFGISITPEGTDRITYLSAGFKKNLDKKVADNFSITPSIGLAKVHRQDAIKWDQGGDVKEVNEVAGYCSLELGRDVSALLGNRWIYGRFFISGNYCQKLFGSVGVRGFIK